MPTSATIGNWKLALGTNASPSVLTDLEEVLDVSELGLTNELQEVTNWDSPAGTKEFIAGLAEGDEFTVECNYISTAGSHQRAVRAAQGQTLPFRLTYTASSPNNVFTGDCVYLGYKMVPSQTEQSKVQYTFKISGDITET
jgi:hypothetical protein